MGILDWDMAHTNLVRIILVQRTQEGRHRSQGTIVQRHLLQFWRCVSDFAHSGFAGECRRGVADRAIPRSTPGPWFHAMFSEPSRESVARIGFSQKYFQPIQFLRSELEGLVMRRELAVCRICHVLHLGYNLKTFSFDKSLRFDSKCVFRLKTTSRSVPLKINSLRRILRTLRFGLIMRIRDFTKANARRRLCSDNL